MQTRLAFTACDQHLAEGLRSVEGSPIRVERVNTARHDWQCIDGHAPATWAIREVVAPVVEARKAWID